MKFALSTFFTIALFSAFSQTFQWVQNIGGTGEDNGYSIATDNWGFVYVAGSFSGTTDFDPGTGNTSLSSEGLTDAFVAKYNSDGSLIWVKAFGSTGYDHSFSVNTDDLGNVLLTGSYSGTVDFNPGPSLATKTSNGGFDAFILKLDGLGNFVWVHSIGNVQNDKGAVIAADSSENVYVAGTFLGNATDLDPTGLTSFFNSSTTDIFILKLNNNGSFQWATALQANADEDEVKDMVVDSVGNCYISGFYYGTAGINGTSSITVAGNNSERDAFIAKILPNGQASWLKSIGGADQDLAQALYLDTEGYLYIGGMFMGTSDMDPGPGNTNFVSGGSWDAYLVKLDTLLGSFVWAVQLEGMSTDGISSIVELPNGNILTNGQFGGMVDFDPGVSQNILSVPGWGSAEFFWTLSSSGGFVDAKMLTSTGKMAISNDGLLYTSGSYLGTSFFNPDNAAGDFLSNPSDYNIFLAKYLVDDCQPNTGIDVQSACVEYTWIDGNTYTQSTNSPTWVLTNVDGCDSTVTLNLTITNLSNVVSQTGNTLTAEESNASYQWLDCLNGMQAISSETEQSFTPLQTGEYAVIVSLNGCETTSPCINVEVAELLESLDAERLIVYPNPSRDKFNVILPTTEINDIGLYAISGEKLESDMNWLENGLTIELQERANGVYFLHISGQERSWQIILIKE